MKKTLCILLAACSVLSAKNKKAVKLPQVTDEACKTFQASKPGLNGFSASVLGGFLSVNGKVENDTTGFSVSNKNTYKRSGLGFSYFWTKENNVVFGWGADLLTEWGAKTINAQGTKKVFLPGPAQTNGILFDPATGQPATPVDVRLPMKYTQKRPLTANVHFKLGYAYGNFIPYVALGIRESYVRHEMVLDGFPKHVEKDVNFGFAPGVGFMYKVGKFGIGADYSYHKESTFGLEGYADKDDQIKNKGGHSVMVRVSYFF